MNIFKTLASGSGSINEPNVSAFLGYLLNPKEDHGLGDAFLRRFLEPLINKNKDLGDMKGRNLSIRSDFEIEILLEQAFKTDNDKNKNEIVDIIILCYERKLQKGMYLAENIIKQKKDGQDNLKQIFLIENKINDASVTSGQLKRQFARMINRLKDWGIDSPKSIVSVIYVTPDGKNSKNEFDKFTGTNNKCHLFWNKNCTASSKIDDDNSYISEFIKEILQSERPPIGDYCRHTLQAFLEFIVDGFKSSITDELNEKQREIYKFLYNGDIYTRPKLAEQIIKDYIDNFKENNKREITFQELSELLPYWNNSLLPFVKEEEAKDAGRCNGGGDRDYFCYYNNPLEIADAKICVLRGWFDDELQQLLDKVDLGKLDDMRIK